MLAGRREERGASRMIARDTNVTQDRPDKKRATAVAHLELVPAGTPGTPEARGFAECPCPKSCSLHGECALCVAYHARKHALPRCERR